MCNSMKDAFKRRYLIRSMKLIMNSSFIVSKLGSLGTMPPSVAAMLRTLGGDSAERRLHRESIQKKACLERNNRLLAALLITGRT